MPISLTDPVIRVLTVSGHRELGCRTYWPTQQDGTLIDLSAMRVDQRSPVVTALAIFSHLLRRYSPSPLVAGEDWLTALRFALGAMLWFLPGGRMTGPNFFNRFYRDWAKQRPLILLRPITSWRPTGTY